MGICARNLVGDEVEYQHDKTKDDNIAFGNEVGDGGDAGN